VSIGDELEEPLALPDDVVDEDCKDEVVAVAAVVAV